jgi:hypothetical protein
MNFHVTINPDSGYLSSLPAATFDYISRMLLKAQNKGLCDVRFAHEHWN